jgi:hypothetical protein
MHEVVWMYHLPNQLLFQLLRKRLRPLLLCLLELELLIFLELLPLRDLSLFHPLLLQLLYLCMYK